MDGLTVRRIVQVLALAAACMGATGCFHRTKAVAAPAMPPPATAPLVPAPESPTAPQVASLPVPATPLPTKPVQPKVKKPRKKIEVAPPPAAVEVAAVSPGPLPANVIGSLTTGGDAAPALQQKAGAAIAEVEKRLAGVPSSTLEAQKDGVTRVKNFLRQAHDALNSGDADGGLNLATKAKVLLDDLLR